MDTSCVCQPHRYTTTRRCWYCNLDWQYSYAWEWLIIILVIVSCTGLSMYLYTCSAISSNLFLYFFKHMFKPCTVNVFAQTMLHFIIFLFVYTVSHYKYMYIIADHLHVSRILQKLIWGATRIRSRQVVSVCVCVGVFVTNFLTLLRYTHTPARPK